MKQSPPKEFFQSTENDGKVLIIPMHSTAASSALWNNENKWYRSRIEDQSGTTVSQGFSKFLNLGQHNPDIGVDANRIIEAVSSGERVVATLKYDGSCLIRSVYDGEVMFRTRGSFSYEHHDSAKDELDLLLEKYPVLANPQYASDRSLLFEWVTPNNQIVVKYDEADLHLLGGVLHRGGRVEDLRYMTIEQLREVESSCGVKLTKSFEINSVEQWMEFYEEVLAHEEIEGYVLRLDDEQTLVKVKAERYVTKHGLKSNLSYKNMVEYWLQHGRGSKEDLVKILEESYDEEVVMWALPFVVELEEAIDEWNKTLERVKTDVSDKLHWARKDFAIEMQKRYTDEKILFGIAMTLWQDLDAKITDQTVRKFMIQFDKEKVDKNDKN